MAGPPAISPVVDLLEATSGTDERDDVRSIRAKATGHVLTLDEGLKSLLPPILWLLDALPEDDGLRDLSRPSVGSPRSMP